MSEKLVFNGLDGATGGYLLAATADQISATALSEWEEVLRIECMGWPPAKHIRSNAVSCSQYRTSKGSKRNER